MNYEFALVFFTVFSQLAIGAAIFTAWRMGPVEENRERLARVWLCVFCSAFFALVCSLFHLGHPLNAFNALYNLGGSWLSAEGLLFAIFCALAFMAIFRPYRWLAVLTAIVGAATLVAQGLTYAQPSMPAINNAFPFVLFTLSALACGACSANLMLPERATKLDRPALLLLVAILLFAPMFWSSGAPVMAQTAALWSGSALFWIGMAFLCWAFVSCFLKSERPKWQVASLVCGLFLTRMVFFADTVHTASRLGLPFN